jgi:hypothetical protein
MADVVAGTYVWCFSHGAMHRFDNSWWCTADWVRLNGVMPDAAEGDKKTRFGSAVFFDDLSPDQRIAVLDECETRRADA